MSNTGSGSSQSYIPPSVYPTPTGAYASTAYQNLLRAKSEAYPHAIPSLAAAAASASPTTPSPLSYSMPGTSQSRPSYTAPNPAAVGIAGASGVPLPHYANYLQTAYPGMASYPGFGTFPTAAVQPVPRARGDDDEEDLPGMDDDDYSAQLQFQSQSKADLKVLLDNFTPDQHARFEAYRRSALNKNGVRKVIQSVTGQQVSPAVAQVVAGIAKVFVGEIVEKARDVQERQGDEGALSPDHLRAAYRMYQEEYGSIGPSQPVKGKKLFVR